MAITREQKKKTFLGSLIQDRKQSFYDQRAIIRAREEADFYRRVIDNGLSTSDQLTYLKNKAQEEGAKSFPDNSYIADLNKRVTDLEKIKRSEDFYNEYRIAYEQFKTSQSNIDDHIAFLERESGSAIDTDLKTKINDLLSNARQEKFTIKNSILQNQITFATNDARESSVSEVLGKVKSARAEAIAVGDNLRASSLDLQIQNLQSTLQNIRITDAVHQIDQEMMDNPSSPVDFVGKLLNKISSASTADLPLTINGKKYTNEKEFWQMQTNDYMDSTFFKTMLDDIGDKLNVAEAKLTPQLESELEKAIKSIDSLQNNPLLAPYLEKFDQLKTKVASAGVEKLGKKIITDYKNGNMGSTASDNIANSIQKLSDYNKKYMVDVQSNIDAIVSDASNKKSAIANSLMEVYQSAKSKGMTDQAAWDYAKKNVSALDVPASEIATSTPLDIAQQTIKEGGQDSTSKFNISKAPTTKPEPAKPVSYTPAPTVPPVGIPEAATPTTTPNQVWTNWGSSSSFGSIVDYLKANKYDSSFGSRAKLFEQTGLGKASDFKGTAEQNTTLLQKFRK